ncbi:MAG: hypothetical protein AAF804_07915 [Bacteroidota bacterium]
MLRHLKSPLAGVRYWAALGFNRMASRSLLNELPPEVYQAWARRDENLETRLMLAEALIKSGEDCEPLRFVLQQVGLEHPSAGMVIQNLGATAHRLESRLIQLKDQAPQEMRFYLRGSLIKAGNLPYEAIYQPELVPQPTQTSTDTLCSEEMSRPSILNNSKGQSHFPSSLPSGEKFPNSEGAFLGSNQLLTPRDASPRLTFYPFAAY